MQHIAVVANKSWEADPLVNALVSDRAIPQSRLGRIQVVRHPFFMHQRRSDDGETLPRISIHVLDGDTALARVDVWCIQDQMDPSKNSSLTIEKARVLPRMLRYEPYSLVVAFGTAACAPDWQQNGSVVVGSRIFAFNPYRDDRDNLWTHPQLGEVVDSPRVPHSLFRDINEDVRFAAEARMLRPPMRSANPPIVLAGHHYVALSNVNIVDYDDYEWADRDLMAEFRKKTQHRLTLGSLETTHGVIRLCAPDDAVFLYVSGIADAVGDFDTDVVPRVYTQNLVAAHNAAVVTAWLIPQIVDRLDKMRREQTGAKKKACAEADTVHASFMKTSAILTGLNDLDPRQGRRHLETLEQTGQAASLKLLLAEMETGSAAEAVHAHPEIVRHVLTLWLAGAMLIKGKWSFPSVEQHFGARMWDVIGAHPPALSGGYYGHWRYPPDNLPVHPRKEPS